MSVFTVPGNIWFAESAIHLATSKLVTSLVLATLEMSKDTITSIGGVPVEELFEADTELGTGLSLLCWATTWGIHNRLWEEFPGGRESRMGALSIAILLNRLDITVIMVRRSDWE